MHWDVVYDFLNKSDIVEKVGKQKIEMNELWCLVKY